MNDKRFNIRISQELYDQMEKKAEEMNITISALIKMVMSNYLKNN